MRVIRTLFIAATGALAAVGLASAAGEYRKPEDYRFSFEGPFSTFDRAAVQRGFYVFNQVCAACHSMEHLAFRHLGQPGGPFHDPDYPNPNDNPVVRAIAAEYIIQDGPDDIGDMFERPGRPADRFPSPYANEAQGRAANNGAYPPDLSVITRARHYGAPYVRSLMMGYGEEPPEGVTVGAGLYYNPYFPGGLIAMPPQLQDGLLTYNDGTEATVEQMATDVTEFLAWASDPHMEQRKSLGLMVLIYLVILCGLLFATYRQIWSKVAH
ncbi:MAG: cytochrome c1 [Caulobacterales bacterium]|uniref:cytochrome c1 n=1 Tax=Glycocaulis sp. TaxID=1969725 RepID=UPI003F9F6A8A